jgi:hypothetical protein
MLLSLLLAVAFADDPAYDHTAKPAEEVPKPTTALSAEFGGTFTSGNAFILAFNGGINGKHDWGQNRFAFGTGVNLNLVKPDTNADGTLQPAEKAQKLTFTSQRITGAIRYDRFFGVKNSLYASAGIERDTFAGLEWRMNQQLGYSRVLVKTEKSDLGLEAGLAYAEENLKEGDDGSNDKVLDNAFIAARVFLGFEHRFNDKVAIGDTVETFFNLQQGEDIRLNNLAYITAKLSDRISLKLSHKLAFDNDPVVINEATNETYVPVDQTTQLTLVASIF